MGIGLGVLIVVPVAALIVGLTVVAIPIAIVALMIYVVLAYASTLVVAYFVSQRVPALQNRVISSTMLCLLALLLLVKLPLLGPGLNFLIHILGMGYLVMHLKAVWASRSLMSSQQVGS